jgi:hypothetical protein
MAPDVISMYSFANICVFSCQARIMPLLYGVCFVFRLSFLQAVLADAGLVDG